MTFLKEDTLSHLHQLLDDQNFAHLTQQLDDLHSGHVADFLESLPLDKRTQVWKVLREAGDFEEVLAYTEGEVRVSLLRAMDASEVAEYTANFDADDAADVLQDMPEDKAEDVLAAMDAQRRLRVEAVLSYAEDTAGGLMDTAVLTVRADVSLETVFRYLRLHTELPDKTDMLLVINRENFFLGGLFLSRLLTHDPDARVAEVMSTDVATIRPETSAHEVANLFEQRDWVSAPVVNANGYLLGRITIDDVVDVIREEAEHSLRSRAGLSEDDDIFAPTLSTARQRALWLGINLATAFLAAWVIGWFEATLEKIVALAVLMPIVASMGGIAGTQTLTVMIRGMALGKVMDSNSAWLMRKELAVGLFNGLSWAVVVGLVATLWFHNGMLGLIIAAAIMINLLFAALSGTLIPLLLKRLGIDPALAGGVILTTVTDVVGFFAFLGLASVFLL